jgi:rhodanese-related sulfurtransferase
MRQINTTKRGASKTQDARFEVADKLLQGYLVAVNTSMTMKTIHMGRGTCAKLMAAGLLLAGLAVAQALPLTAAPPAAAEGRAEVFKDLKVEEFAKLAADKGNAILDVRTSREYAAGHLAGALNLDIHSPDFEKKAGEIGKDKTCLVYCASGVRSVKACKVLGQLGFVKIYNLPGGFGAWSQAGKPVAK